MKKIFGFILIGLGIVSIIQYFSNDSYIGGAEAFGALLGVSLICFLPAFFLLRNKKKFIDVKKDKEQ